jgi:hypothetical protein
MFARWVDDDALVRSPSHHAIGAVDLVNRKVAWKTSVLDDIPKQQDSSSCGLFVMK